MRQPDRRECSLFKGIVVIQAMGPAGSVPEKRRGEAGGGEAAEKRDIHNFSDLFTSEWTRTCLERSGRWIRINNVLCRSEQICQMNTVLSDELLKLAEVSQVRAACDPDSNQSLVRFSYALDKAGHQRHGL